MTYTEQANKRGHCQRLTSFIRLADYLIVNTMHVLVVNSVEILRNYLSEQLQVAMQNSGLEIKVKEVCVVFRLEVLYTVNNFCWIILLIALSVRYFTGFLVYLLSGCLHKNKQPQRLKIFDAGQCII